MNFSLLKDFNSNEKAQDAVAKRPLEDLIYLNPDGNSLKGTPLFFNSFPVFSNPISFVKLKK